ncbi:MAG: homoprotocatechuate degradation operon regulator HpaR [Phyllobacteriaceae bacterium]|nr:homoprotocatechuate degradation operon regulator HpaR [Phyllobacteriaceae bacterium]MBA89865.1 homoprotocatechuate degradation operon regulator HpaR [Phyllobacteriaceae bacterium]
MTDDTDHAQSARFAPTARSLPIALLRARETVMGPIRVMLQQSGISEQQWRVLRVLDELGEIEQSAIATGACLQLPSLTRMLRTMEADGLIARRTDEADRRRTLVRITDKGRALILAHLPDSAAIFSRLEERFGARNLKQLLDLLDELRRIDL